MILYQSEIKEALNRKKPIVALESTIISHGMPYPQNVEMALKIEERIRNGGAIPATIALIEGKVKVGLSSSEIELLGKEGTNVYKTSRRDLPYVISKQLNGATTVAATMIIAQQAGISIFATGGIGGVHREGAQTMDISADLQELAQTNVAVISAGVKSILDIGLTLEYLETMGVPVLGYQTEDFPAFYTRKSGFKVDFNMRTPQEIATFLKTKWEMDLQGGVLVSNPIPQKYSMDEQIIDKAIQEALLEAKKRNITGKAITPFLLSYIKKITKGKSLAANIELVFNNAQLAAEVAIEYAKIT